ncbi:hypothetical protein HXX76_004323 [Chlamydomonas incerta]|uniref:Uncharacterized protein n=1 Tax=Chlamydomonas incerta TaxID=51695 RepID=A0A835TKH0_CHLIN|nr:hypothetical protein HXX76_004323 [Chlamydomonas incerta]|eukprot:KAG2440211.1 hypothetical protein HXX76_004323 [Chlamydomonas incerta]
MTPRMTAPGAAALLALAALLGCASAAMQVTNYRSSGAMLSYGVSAFDDCSYRYAYFYVSEYEARQSAGNTYSSNYASLWGYASSYSWCGTATEYKGYDFYASAPTVTGLGLTSFSIPSSARSARVKGTVSATCYDYSNWYYTPCASGPVTVTIDITDTCDVPSASKSTYEYSYPGGTYRYSSQGVYCYSSLQGVGISVGGLDFTGSNSYAQYGTSSSSYRSRYQFSRPSAAHHRMLLEELAAGGKEAAAALAESHRRMLRAE